MGAEFNKDAIVIVRQPDGNWIGEMWKYDRVISARGVSPDEVLLMLNSHDGTDSSGLG